MNNENKDCGQRIRNMRESQKLSREKLAEMSSISTQFLADIETGKKGMTVNTLRKICDALKVSSDSIVFGTNNTNHVNIDSMLSKLNIDDQKKIEEILQHIISLL